MANAYAALTGMEAPIEDHMFTDVAGDPNADDIARISPNGLMITTGTSDTTYSPDNPVVRGHMALFLTRLYKAVTGSDAPAGTTPFTDIGDRPAGEQAAIGAIYALGVTTGTTDTTYSPHGNVTREQMASFVARMYRAIDAQAPALDAPASVSASPTGTTGTSLEVTWDAVDGATSYTVQWGADYNNQTTTSSTSTTIGALTKGTTYNIRVAANDGDSRSDWTMTTGTPATPPGAVVDLTITAGNAAGTLTASWKPPTDDGGSDVTGYTVHWATGRSAPQMADTSSTTYTITGLVPGAEYRVHVQAVNAAGDGAITAPSTSTPTTTVSSGAVKITLPRPVDRGGYFTAVTWPTPTLRSGQTINTTGGYTVQRKCGTQNWPATPAEITARQVVQDPDATTAIQTLGTAALRGDDGDTSDGGSLMNGVECTFRVKATTNLGDTPWMTGSATPVGIPGTPTVTVTPFNQSLVVSWTPAMVAGAIDDGGSPITGYEITLNSGGPVGQPISVAASARSYTITGLINGAGYTVVVAAVNDWGKASSAASASTSPTPVPAAPTGVRLAQATGADQGTTLVAGWNAPAPNGTPAVSGYVVQVRNSAIPGPLPAARCTTSTSDVPAGKTCEAGAWAAASGTVNVATRSVDVGSLTAGVSYDVQVRATNATGNGPWSTFASGTPVAAVARPGSVTAITAIPGNGMLSLTWPAVQGATSYTVEYSADSGFDRLWRSVGTTSTTYRTIGGLTNGTAYSVRVTASNSGGSAAAFTSGDDAATATSRTPVNTVLAAPSSVTATPTPKNTDGTQMDVTWSTVNGATGYLVEYDDGTNTWTSRAATDAEVAARKATLTGLTRGTLYTVRVRGTEATNNAAGGVPGYSAAVRANGTPTAPAITSVTATGTTLTVVWTHGTVVSEGVTGFVVSWFDTADPLTGDRDTAPVAANATRHNITGLGDGTYTVIVTAVNSVGTTGSPPNPGNAISTS